MIMIRALILTLFLTNISSLKAQNHLFVKAGTAYSNIFDYSISSYGFELGAQLGCLYTHDFKNDFNFRTELLYCGQFLKKSVDENTRARKRLHYLSMPVLAGYSIKKVNIELGPEFFYMLNYPESPNKFEFGLATGVSYFIREKLLLNARSSLSVTTIDYYLISDDGNIINNSSLRNFSLQFSVAYRLF